MQFLFGFSIVTFLYVIQWFQHGSAIKCYVCDSTDNPSCADLATNSTITPEECTLDKMRSIDSWLFELNRFAYFETGANKRPLMNCQKVVTREPNSNKMVTARFCQLNTGDSDACAILRSKLRLSTEEKVTTKNNEKDSGSIIQFKTNTDTNPHNKNNPKNNNNNNDDDNKKGHDVRSNVGNQEFHCSICDSDGCNGASTIIHSALLLRTKTGFGFDFINIALIPYIWFLRSALNSWFKS